MELLFAVPCIFDKEANQSAKKKKKKKKKKRVVLGMKQPYIDISDA